MRVLKCIFLGLFIVTHYINANCRNILFDKNGIPVNDSAQIVISEHKTPLYNKVGKKFTQIGSLDFNTKYFISKREDDYFQIKKNKHNEAVGYVNIYDVFCGGTPLKAKSGLLKKFYIKTEVHEKGTNSFVKAYPSSKGNDCGENEKFCSKLKRFNSYYIFKEKNGRYLLSKSNQFRPEDILTGWVNKKDGFIWKTAIGIRPADNLTDNEPIYFYKNIEDIRLNKTSGAILGGMRWYDIPIRIPVLEKVKVNGEPYYKVTFPTEGIGVKKRNGSLEFTNKGLQNSGERIINKHNQVDIMFLVDGTQSMQPYIDKIVGKNGIIDRLSNTLLKDQKYKGLILRTSYRVYRDNFAGNKNLGEGEPITATCGQPFKKTNYNIKASNNDKDDFKENLFGGIKQALSDIRRCPNNKKIIFIIGDAGDRNEGNKFNELINRIKNMNNRLHHVVLVFIQTPKNNKISNNEYNNAYNSFKKQYEKFKKELDPKNRGIVTYFKSNDQNLINKILNSQTIAGYLNLEFLRETILNLQNGENLKETIERLSSQDKYRSIPGIYMDEIIDGSCKELGKEACEGKVYNVVIDSYIKATPKISEDVFFIESEFDSMYNMMNNIVNKIKSSGGSINREDRRKMLIELLRDALSKTTHQTIFDKETNERIDEFLNKYGLPTRENSPLFKHTISRLQDQNKVSDETIQKLFGWILTSKEILNIVHQNKIPILKLEKGSSLSDEVPKYDRPIRDKQFPYIENEHRQMAGYHYMDEIQKIRYMWVPKIFLP